MARLLLTIRYDGTRYHGWQVQQNALTVQEVLQDAVERVTGVRSGITGCSRTDAGVHALRFCCAMDTDSPLREDRMIRALNACLPADIAVYECREVPPDFHPRYMAQGKRYGYYIWNGMARQPFYGRYALHRVGKLDEAGMNDTASLFLGTHDFSAFCASGSGVEDRVRTVRTAHVNRNGDGLCFHVEADGFLYSMVRIMVGSLLDVQAGRRQNAQIAEALRTGNRSLAGFTAPAHGLFLEDVFYPEEVFAWQTNGI